MATTENQKVQIKYTIDLYKVPDEISRLLGTLNTSAQEHYVINLRKSMSVPPPKVTLTNYVDFMKMVENFRKFLEDQLITLDDIQAIAGGYYTTMIPPVEEEETKNANESNGSNETEQRSVHNEGSVH